jgi:hypothetical protein
MPNETFQLEFTHHQDKPSLRRLVLHDDAERELASPSGAERALEKAGTSGWAGVSMKDGFATVFGTVGGGKEPADHVKATLG